MEPNKLPERPASKYVLGIFLVLVAVVGAIVFGIYLKLKANRLDDQVLAQVPTASISFNPNQQVLPPDLPMSVTIDVGTAHLAFARVLITFDQTKVNLASEITLDPDFGTVVEKTTVVQANATGQIVVVAGVSPGTTAPTGTISNFLTFNLTSISGSPDDTTQLLFNTTDMQLVDAQYLTQLSLIPNGATYILNQTATPTPSPSPEPTVVPTPTPTSSGDSQPPTVAITTPADGAIVSPSSSVVFQATASDNVGVTKVEFYVNGVKKCTDTTVPYRCSWAVPSDPNTIYTLEAKAFDVANNITTHQITVTSSN